MHKLIQSFLYHASFYRLFDPPFRKLHLGSGKNSLDGFCNIDANPLSKCNIVSGIEKIKLKSWSLDLIYTAHAFEHLARHRALPALREWHRVLKPGGKLYLCVPDLEALCRIYLVNLPPYREAAAKSRADLACNIMYGGQVSRYDYHFYGYSFSTLEDFLKTAGFGEIKRFERTDFPGGPLEDGSGAEIGGVSVSLNLEAVK